MLPASIQANGQLWGGSQEAASGLAPPSFGTRTSGAPGSPDLAPLTATTTAAMLASLNSNDNALQDLGLDWVGAQQLKQLLMQQSGQGKQDQSLLAGMQHASPALDAAWQGLQSTGGVDPLEYTLLKRQQQQTEERLLQTEQQLLQAEQQLQAQQALFALSSGLNPTGAGTMPLAALLDSGSPSTGASAFSMSQQLQLSQPMQQGNHVLFGEALAQRLFGSEAAGMAAPHMSLNNPPRPYRPQQSSLPFDVIRAGTSTHGSNRPRAGPKQPRVAAAPPTRAPMWADPSWHPMAAVVSSGNKGSGGTGVFIPKTSLQRAPAPAAAAPAAAAAGPMPLAGDASAAAAAALSQLVPLPESALRWVGSMPMGGVVLHGQEVLGPGLRS